METEIGAILTLGLIAVGVVWFYGPWQTLCIDWARQRLFEARDQLFDLAAQGKMSFNSTQYVELRRGFETTIRFAHKVSWPRLLCFWALLPSVEAKSSVVDALERISDPEIKKDVLRIIYKVAKAVTILLVSRSLILLVIAVALYLVWQIHKQVGGTIKICADAVYELVQRIAEQNQHLPHGSGMRIRHT